MDGVLDVGTVTMRPVPLLVAGTVVDREGKPVEGAVVSLLAGGDQGPSVGPRPTPDLAPGPGDRLTMKTGSTGFFLLRFGGDATGGGKHRPLLTAKKGEAMIPEPLEFRVGEREVVLTLTEPGKIEIDATGLSADGLVGIALKLGPRGGQGVASTIDPGRRTVLENQRPGPYTVEVEMFPETAFVAQDLKVEAGKTLKDPRLNPLTLQGVVQWRNLYVTGPKGAPLSEITVARVYDSGVVRSVTVPEKEGAFRVAAYLNIPADSYWVEAPGCRREVLSALGEGMTIELKSAIGVTLELRGAKLPGRAFSLRAVEAGSSGAGGARCGSTPRGELFYRPPPPGASS